MSAFIKTVGKEVKAVGKELLTDTARSIAKQATDSVKNVASQKIRQYSDKASGTYTPPQYQSQYQMIPPTQYQVPQQMPPAPPMTPQMPPAPPMTPVVTPMTQLMSPPPPMMPVAPPMSPPPSNITHTGCSCSCPRTQTGGAANLMKLTKSDLKEIAGALRIKGRSQLKTKDQLAGAIVDNWKY